MNVLMCGETISGIRRFLGMINQLGKFTPHLAEITKPMRDLLSKKNDWTWGHAQKMCFAQLKESLTSAPVLALYNAKRETTLSADASSYGLGAVLLQKQPDGELRPVAYASRAMSGVEQRYAQIEKEALATTWACERFSDFLIGKTFHIETDHKPLVSLLGQKTLDELPPRIQRNEADALPVQHITCTWKGLDNCRHVITSTSGGKPRSTR